MKSISSLLSVGQNWTNAVTKSFSHCTSGEELRVSALHDPPYFFINSHPDGSHSYDGYLYELWKVLAREAGVRYQIIPLPTPQYGGLDGNGTWTGLMGELVYGRADVGLSWLSRTLVNGTSAVDLLDAIPVSWYQSTFYVRRGPAEVPQITSRTFESLLKPLHSDVWWALLASLLVLSVGLRVTLRFNHARAESKQTVDGMSWGSCLLNSFLSVVGQGWAATPDSLAARTVTISCWVLGIILHSSYTANLMSHLTVAPPSQPISSLQEFVERHDWTLATEAGAIILKWNVSRNEHERELFRRFDLKDRYIELSPGSWPQFDMMDKFLIHTDMQRLRYAFGQDSCLLTTMLDEPLQPPTATHIAIAKGRGALRKDLNRALITLSEAGLVQRLMRKWLKKSQDVCDSAIEFKSLSFSNLLAMLLIVPLAVISSVVILALEWLWYRRQYSLGQKVTAVGQVSGVGGRTI